MQLMDRVASTSFFLPSGWVVGGKALNVRGLMNIQFAIKDDTLYFIEVNPRASRTVPFVSKATGKQWAKIATKVMTGRKLAEFGRWCLEQLREEHGCDIDGGDAQDAAERIGILERVTVTELHKVEGVSRQHEHRGRAREIQLGQLHSPTRIPSRQARSVGRSRFRFFS